MATDEELMKLTKAELIEEIKSFKETVLYLSSKNDTQSLKSAELDSGRREQIRKIENTNLALNEKLEIMTAQAENSQKRLSRLQDVIYAFGVVRCPETPVSWGIEVLDDDDYHMLRHLYVLSGGEIK